MQLANDELGYIQDVLRLEVQEFYETPASYHECNPLATLDMFRRMLPKFGLDLDAVVEAEIPAYQREQMKDLCKDV